MYHSVLTELLDTIRNPTCQTSCSSCIVHLIKYQCSNNEGFRTSRQSIAILYSVPEHQLGISVSRYNPSKLVLPPLASFSGFSFYFLFSFIFSYLF